MYDYFLPKTGIEPILESYKESVLPIKLYRLLYIEFYYLPLIIVGEIRY
jgi:hypothetical protein